LLTFLMIAGTYQVKPSPYIPGMEFAGIVEALGPDTKGPAPGTRVLGVSGTGALAEWLCLPADRLVALARRDAL
jgi:NADPH:quinone reductase